MGHLGSESVFQLANERFYWPGMRNDIEHYTTRVRAVPQLRKKTDQFSFFPHLTRTSWTLPLPTMLKCRCLQREIES